MSVRFSDTVSAPSSTASSPSPPGETSAKSIVTPQPTPSSRRTQPAKAFRRSSREKTIFYRGDAVEDTEGFRGTVAWTGVVQSGDVKGEYVGVVWDEGAERGHLDGSYKGVRYFTCDPYCGSLCLPSQIRLQKSGVGESAIMRERCKRAVMHAAVVNALTRSVTTTLLQRVFLFWKTTTLMKAQHRELIDEFGSAMLSTEVQTAPTPPPATVTCTATSPIREIPVHPMASSQTTPVVLKEPQPIQREIHCYCSIC